MLKLLMITLMFLMSNPAYGHNKPKQKHHTAHKHKSHVKKHSLKHRRYRHHRWYHNTSYVYYPSHHATRLWVPGKWVGPPWNRRWIPSHYIYVY